MIEAERKLVVMETPREAETQKQATSGGAAAMREAASMVLEDRGVDIALALADSSLGGHIQCAKFLYDLAELQQKLGKTDVARQISSLAGELAAEPEWNAEMSEETAETAVGNREPEN